MADSDAEAQGKRRLFGDSSKKAQVSEDGSVRTPDGPFFSGEEIARVHQDGRVTKRDLLWDRPLDGRIEGKRVVHDGILFQSEYGFVDDEGQVWLNCGIFAKRIVGQAKGRNPERALAFFIAKFDQLEQEIESFDQEVRRDFDKSRSLGKIKGKLSYLEKACVVGDIGRLKARLEDLLRDAEDDLQEHTKEAQILIWKAESIAESEDWKGGKAKIEALREDWKKLGGLPRNINDELWEKFQGACQSFFDGRRRWMAERSSQEESNAKAARSLIERAHAIASLQNWKSGGEELAALMEEWKAIGRLPFADRDRLWEEFSRAKQGFFDARRQHFEERDREQQRNLSLKEGLIRRVERLAASSQLRDDKAEVIEIQREWRQIGHVPREESERVHQEFREACDSFFDALNQETIDRLDARIAKQEEFIDKLRTSNTQAEEFISKLEDFKNPPWDKIEDVRGQISERESKISEVEDQIEDMRAKVRDLQR